MSLTAGTYTHVQPEMHAQAAESSQGFRLQPSRQVSVSTR